MKRILSVSMSLSVLLGAVAPLSVSAAGSGNPVIKGSYADPDIDYFDCKYWIFPTTDGNPGWSGTQFHAFSSNDLLNWTDEGVILDVADKTPGKNAKGVQIASSPWSAGNAWAPTIEKVNGKYYFYYCARVRDDLLDKYAVQNPDGYYNDKAIGVAVADNPVGPYTALDEPILYPSMIRDMGLPVGQMIDPSVFIDTDGTPYLFFGNCVAYSVRLGDDMVSIKQDTVFKYNIWEFVESLVVFKRNGKYYFTWSDFGTGDERYCVKYAVCNTLESDADIKPKNNKPILSMDSANAIYGTGHQSVLYNPIDDEYYIAYGRHQTKDGKPVDDPGNFREVCIDKISFNIMGDINVITPTNSGVAPVYSHNDKVTKATLTKNGTVKCTKCGAVRSTIYYPKTITLSATKYTYDGKVKKPTVKVVGSNGKTIAASNYTVAYSNNKNVGKATVKVTFKGNYSGTKTLNFTINPKNTSISGLTAGSKKFTVKIKKYTTQTTGYQIQYATNSSFKSAKTVTVKNTVTSKAVSKLTAKKKYYVRIRTYKTVNKVNYYSAWSGTKTVTTKK